MKIEPFLLERWMTRHETHVRFDIAESGILPLSTNDLLDFEPVGERAATLERLLSLPLGYSEARGTAELRAMLAATYTRADADQTSSLYERIASRGRFVCEVSAILVERSRK